MRVIQKRFWLACALALTFGGCSNDATLNGTGAGGGPTGSFRQIDRVGRPSMNTIFATFAKHDTNDRTTPSDDATNIKNDIGTFMTTNAGRSAPIVAYGQALLSPNVLIADLSKTAATATFLGVETNGKLGSNGKPCPGGTACGSLFGGRAFADDVIDAALGIAFGNTIPALSAAGVNPPGVTGAVPDDLKELDGTGGKPNLTADNVAAPAPARFTATFPYLGAPH